MALTASHLLPCSFSSLHTAHRTPHNRTRDLHAAPFRFSALPFHVPPEAGIHHDPGPVWAHVVKPVSGFEIDPRSSRRYYSAYHHHPLCMWWVLRTARNLRVSTDCSLAIGITILCYDTLLRFGDEVRGGSLVQSGLLVSCVEMAPKPRLVDRCT